MLAAHFCLDIPSTAAPHEKQASWALGSEGITDVRQGSRLVWSFCCAVLETANF